MINTPHKLVGLDILIPAGDMPSYLNSYHVSVASTTGRWETLRDATSTTIRIEIMLAEKAVWVAEDDITLIWEPIVNDCSR